MLTRYQASMAVRDDDFAVTMTGPERGSIEQATDDYPTLISELKKRFPIQVAGYTSWRQSITTLNYEGFSCESAESGPSERMSGNDVPQEGTDPAAGPADQTVERSDGPEQLG